MANHPHTIDRWDDATGENLIEQIAAVGDYLVALETYRAAVKRWPGAKITLRNRARSSSGVGGISRSTTAQGRRHHHQVRKLRYDLGKKKQDRGRKDESDRYREDVNAVVDWIGHRLGLSTSSKWR